jgi:hypothetical protein
MTRTGTCFYGTVAQVIEASTQTNQPDPGHCCRHIFGLAAFGPETFGIAALGIAVFGLETFGILTCSPSYVVPINRVLKGCELYGSVMAVVMICNWNNSFQ